MTSGLAFTLIVRSDGFISFRFRALGSSSIGDEMNHIDAVDEETISEAAALISAIRDFEKNARGALWTDYLYRVSDGTYDIWPGKPDWREPHVQLLIQLKIVDKIRVNDGIRLRLLHEDLADQFIRAYMSGLKSATSEIMVVKGEEQ